MAAITPPEIKKTVVFLFSADDPARPLGTGFWVSVPFTSDANKLLCFIITARHVIEGRDRVKIRLSLATGEPSTGFGEICLTSGRNRALVHPNPAVDIAAIPCAPARDAKAVYKVLTRDMFATKSFCHKQQVLEGDEVFFVGMMPHFYGQLQNLPVVRHGRIALMTDEMYPTDKGPTRFIYVEANSYGGNSGSPVFLRLGETRQPGTLTLGGERIMLLGVMKGYFQQGTLLKPVDVQQPAKLLEFFENINIALVSPVDYLVEILDSAEAKALRGES